ncbi:MAG: enoyl-CoA hydratase/isomerase family protein [Gemmatimonadetes bacterium]|nr:enoyl-CoA hydratase/isomerase family protein [Gemmatimonadota bacterium]
METTSHVLVEREGAVGVLRLNRPEKLNAFAGDMRDQIGDALEALAEESDVRAILITGEGRGFCAGADIGYLNELVAEENEKDFARLLEAGERVVGTIRSIDQPVIAAINGPAAGGGANLALACDLRIMSEAASIGQTFSRIGLHPDWGGTYFLPRLVGEARALELMWSGRMVGAEEALAIGLVNRVVPAERFREEALAWARQMAARPPIAVARIKHAVHQSRDSSLEQMLEVEMDNQLACFASEDATRGLFAFGNKEKPRFEGT